ncbi:MAG: hypothetical protein IPH78_15180 [Bacteroidetes bacterium]|nr:hypothetical protein [Bacteroidota bacterium]MBK8659967.1 hypothetical protein [Bacteroidota bacterium]
MTIHVCSTCTKPFMAWEQKLDVPAYKLMEPLTCPYCGDSTPVESVTWWNTQALTEEEQQDYLSSL